MEQINRLADAPQNGSATSKTLHRELGLYDLTLLLVVAVVNVNILPAIAAEGWPAMILWVFGFAGFLIPQAIAVIYFSRLYPGEGGIYSWTREVYGEFHGFISGWCYWTNNLFYIPSILFILVGVGLYAGGSDAIKYADQKSFMMLASLILLWLVTALHLRGLKLGKWLNNLGALGAWISLAMLVIIAVLYLARSGSPATPINWNEMGFNRFSILSGFSITVYSLVGLELGSVMGDEIRNPQSIVRRAVILGAIFSIGLYWIGTAAVLIAVPSSEIVAISGLMQAVAFVSEAFQFQSLVPAIAILVSTAILGICSAWLAGSARIPFVMGIGSYLPSALGRIHPKWNTPHVALLVQGILSSLLILLMLYGSTVGDAYRALLDSSIVIQLIPFLYLFAALWKRAKKVVPAILGLISTSAALLFAYVPSRDIENVFLFEIKMILGPLFVLAIAFFFYRMASRKQAQGEKT